MLKTFNCGVGFCLIINPKKLSKVKNILQIDLSHMWLEKFPKEKIKLN